MRGERRTLLVNLKYIYKAQGDVDNSGVTSYGVLLEGAAQILECDEFQLLKTGARRVGEHVLERFPEVCKLTVCVTRVRAPVARAASEVPVEANSVR